MASTTKANHVPGFRKASPFAKKAVAARAATAKAIKPKRGSLNEKAMLVAITVRRWHIGKHLKGDAEEKIAKAIGAEQEMVRGRKDLVRKDAISAMRNIEAELRETFKILTLPWDDSGYRVLSTAAYFTFMARINKLIADYNAAADSYVLETDDTGLSAYERDVEEAKRKLGPNWDKKDYPTKDALRTQYVAGVQIRPIPEYEDLRIDIGATEYEMITKTVREQVSDAMTAANKDVWNRFAEVLTNLVERLKVDKVNIRSAESSVNHIRELLDIVPILNVSDDPQVTEFAQRIKSEIAMYGPDELKTNPVVRQKATDAADDILKKMSAFVA